MLKKEIRILGIDDAPFDKFKNEEVLIIGTIFRGGNFLEGILSTKVTIDGDDATEKLVTMINSSKFKSLIRAIILDGIAVGGFNMVDIDDLNKKTGIGIIVVVRKNPNISEIKMALTKINKKEKIKLIEKAGELQKIDRIYTQFKGLDIEVVREILKLTCTRSHIPEPVRIAHLIASGVVTGESKGRA